MLFSDPFLILILILHQFYLTIFIFRIFPSRQQRVVYPNPPPTSSLGAFVATAATTIIVIVNVIVRQKEQQGGEEENKLNQLIRLQLFIYTHTHIKKTKCRRYILYVCLFVLLLSI